MVFNQLSPDVAIIHLVFWIKLNDAYLYTQGYAALVVILNDKILCALCDLTQTALGINLEDTC